MENYDSEEGKKKAEALDALLAKANLTPEQMELVTKAVSDIKNYVLIYYEKKKDGTLTKEEEDYFMKNIVSFNEILERISDFKLLLENKLFHDSEKLMEGLKKAGEAGDVEAQKAYEEMYKKWLEAGNEDRGLN
jgi:hypothetical protein